jgi:hypothetical protein
MTFDHTEASRKLETDVRELNEFLSRQHIEGGVHQGYVRIFQNGDDPSFNWDYGGRLEPPRDCRRLFCLSHAATAVSAIMA